MQSALVQLEQKVASEFIRWWPMTRQLAAGSVLIRCPAAPQVVIVNQFSVNTKFGISPHFWHNFLVSCSATPQAPVNLFKLEMLNIEPPRHTHFLIFFPDLLSPLFSFFLRFRLILIKTKTLKVLWQSFRLMSIMTSSDLPRTSS